MRSYCNLIFLDFSRTVLEFVTILCCTIFDWLVSYQEGSGVYESNRGTAQRAQARNDGKMLWMLCRKRADGHGNQGFGSGVRLHYGKSLFVFQQNTGNKHSPTTIVAVITGRKTKAALPTHVAIMTSGLKTESTVLLEQIRTIDKARLGEYIHYQCWLTSWYQQNANQLAQKQGQYSENHKEPDSSSVQMFWCGSGGRE